MNITLDHVYWLTGLFLLIFTVYTVLDAKQTKKWGTAAFWALYGITFIWGGQIPPMFVGLMVVVMSVIGAAKWMGPGAYNEFTKAAKTEWANRYKDWLFIPPLIVVIITFLIAKYTKMGALVGMGIGSVVALGVALLMTKESIGQTFNEGRRMCDSIGWAIILSQFLAALGFLFDKAGVGKVIATMVSSVVAADNVLACVAAYCIGMALFTMIMGNAFAAFAVITSGIGLPLVIKMHGGDPAIVGVIAMVSGYCGTLMTPMAANFNVVPAALLEMSDKNGVMKAQILTAIPLLLINIFLMYFLGFKGVK